MVSIRRTVPEQSSVAGISGGVARRKAWPSRILPQHRLGKGACALDAALSRIAAGNEKPRLLTAH